MKSVVVASALMLLPAAAHAHGRHHHHHHDHYVHHRHGHSRFARHEHNDGGRPHAWCGWFMRHLVGHDPGPEYNRAAAWAHLGHPTSPHPGAIVVYPHHVAKIVGECHGDHCLMISGNDGHAVRTRERRLSGHIAIVEL